MQQELLSRPFYLLNSLSLSLSLLDKVSITCFRTLYTNRTRTRENLLQTLAKNTHTHTHTVRITRVFFLLCLRQYIDISIDSFDG